MTAEDAELDASVPVSVVIAWLGRVGQDELARLLSGCALDDGENDALLPIAGCDAAAATLMLADGRRVSLRRVAGGAIVDPRPGRPLLAAIDGAKTPADRREAAVRAALRRRRLDPGSLGSLAEREQVLGFLAALDRGETPAEPALHTFYVAMKPAVSSAKHRRAAEALSAMLAGCARHGNTPPSLPWRLAWFLNQSGQFDEVVRLSETPQGRAAQGMDRAILATIRGSALLSLAKIRHDRKPP